MVSSASNVSAGWIEWLPLGLGAALALAALETARTRVNVEPDQAAYGTQTSLYAAADADRVQCQDSGDSALCIQGWQRAGSPPVILWLGNSQLMAINRSRAGDVTAPILLQRAMAPSGYRVVTYAQPNANLSETRIVFDAVAPVFRPRLVVLPVCFDDFRELAVRPMIAAMRGEAPRREVAGRRPGEVAPADTVQGKVEAKLTHALGEAWPLWRRRQKLAGIGGLLIHEARNRLLGIHSTSKRPVEPHVYRARMRQLGELVAQARSQGMAVLLYVPPYRDDIDGPYVAGEYARLKADLRALAGSQGARFADLEHIVPGPEWATVSDGLLAEGEPDFMHFTERGHERLTAAVAREVRAMGFAAR